MHCLFKSLFPCNLSAALAPSLSKIPILCLPPPTVYQKTTLFRYSTSHPSLKNSPVNFDTLGTWDSKIELPLELEASINYGKPIPKISVSAVGLHSLQGRRFMFSTETTKLGLSQPSSADPTMKIGLLWRLFDPTSYTLLYLMVTEDQNVQTTAIIILKSIYCFGLKEEIVTCRKLLIQPFWSWTMLTVDGGLLMAKVITYYIFFKNYIDFNGELIKSV